MAWRKIEDYKVNHVWKKADDDECEDVLDQVDISPDWYQNNGTPVCECGQDMVYSHTEINIG